MKLIFALGNPGKEYRFTRHNFGHLALDFYAKVHDLDFVSSKKFHAELAEQGSTIFVKPTSYYNEIGQPISQIIKFYKVPLEDILIICDDFTLPFGTIRLRASGSSAGNNGLKSIIQHLGTTDFPRLRLGTGSDSRAKLDDATFVLSRFTDSEKSELPTILSTISTQITDFLA